MSGVLATFTPRHAGFRRSGKHVVNNNPIQGGDRTKKYAHDDMTIAETVLCSVLLLIISSPVLYSKEKKKEDERWN